MDVASQLVEKVRLGEEGMVTEYEVARHFCSQSGSRALNVVFRSFYPFQLLQGLNPGMMSPTFRLSLPPSIN